MTREQMYIGTDNLTMGSIGRKNSYTIGSGSEIPDFQLEDPDQKLLISEPEHWVY